MSCDSTLAMTVGPRDAAILAELLRHGVTAESLMEAPKYHGYSRLLVEGVPHTLSMATQRPICPSAARADIVRAASRDHFGFAPATA